MTDVLNGIRVLDLSHSPRTVLFNHACPILAAEVIKIEEPRIGDPTGRGPSMIDSQSPT
jgi:crotonobetainyl-CoA:carnitine CoA-transferase CaiB-like acyl-CoA transferase